MTHYEVAELASDYLDSALEGARRAELEAHLASCATCRGLIDDMRLAVSACRATAPCEPSPWLVQRILLQTVGQREANQPGWGARLRLWLRPSFRPRIVYGIAMTVFSLSFILFTARVKLRAMNLRDWNPATWVYQANSRGHLLVARAEKFYYDLRFVYEVQTVLHELGQRPGSGANTPAKPGRPNDSRRTPPPGSRQLVFLGHPHLAAVQTGNGQAGLCGAPTAPLRLLGRNGRAVRSVHDGFTLITEISQLGEGKCHEMS